MSWPIFIRSAALGLLLPLQAVALDFTPRPETQVIDDYPIHFFSFADGDRRVEYGPPSGWTCTGGGSQLSLLDPQNGQAQATFTVTPEDQPQSLTPETLQAYKAATLALVPAGGESPTILETVAQHPVGNRPAYTATINYIFYGQKYCLRATFLDLGKSCLRMVVTAPQGKFDPFAKALDGSLFSWHWVGAK